MYLYDRIFRKSHSLKNPGKDSLKCQVEQKDNFSSTGIDDVDWLASQIRQVVPEQKGFDWDHYRSIQETAGAFSSEFDLIPSARVMRSLYAREQLVHLGVNAIAKQFMNCRFILVRRDSEGNKQKLDNQPICNVLNRPGSDAACFFWTTAVIDLICTGNAFLWDSPTGKLIRLPSDRVEVLIQGGEVFQYRITPENGANSQALLLGKDEVTAVKLPNPFSPFVGLPLLVASCLPILLDKYGHEFMLSFFLRGGNTTGIIETNTSNVNQLTRLFKTIMQAFGSRRNMHADKVLPEGAKWVGRGLTMTEMQLQELLKSEARRLMADLGVPNFLMGDSETVNYANAREQMQSFWKLTILPLQGFLTSSIKHGALWQKFGLSEEFDLEIDNSHVEYLDDFRQRLDDDSKLASVWTINERRERLGKERFPEEDPRGNLLQAELGSMASPAGFEPVAQSLSMDPSKPPETHEAAVSVPVEHDFEGEWKAQQFAEQDDIPRKSENVFNREFAAWEEIFIANITNRAKAEEEIEKRAEAFAEKVATANLEKMLKAYDAQMHTVLRLKGVRGTKEKTLHVPFKTKETEQDRIAKLEALRERAKEFLYGKEKARARRAFQGYSKTQSQRIYDLIDEKLAEGASIDDAASNVRRSMGEFYEGQALTIVRTEYQSSLAESWGKFGEDLSTVSKKMKKIWLAKMDDFTRDSHREMVEAGKNVIEDDSDRVPDRTFENGLRYPKDSKANSPGEVINCRCVVSYRVTDWGE